MSVKSKLSSYILKVSSFIFKRKESLRESRDSVSLLGNAVIVIASELYLIVVSLPTYLLVSESDLKEQGFDDAGIKSYQLKKKISLSTVGIGVFFFVVRFAVLTVTSVWLGQFLGVEAATVNWDLASKGDYVYSKSVQITDGMAVLKKDKKADECSGYVYNKEALSVSNLKEWTDFTVISDAGSGEIGYQVSLDGGDSWLYWNGSAWVGVVDDSSLNTSSEVSSNIGEIGSENTEISVKAVLYGSCDGDVKLLDMGVSYEITRELVARRKLDSNVAEISGDLVIGNPVVGDGVDGSSLLLDGVDDSYRVANSSEFPEDMVSLVIWAKPNEQRTAHLVDKGDWKSTYTLGQDKWNGWQGTLRIDGTNHDLEAGRDSIVYDAWNLVVLTYDGASMRLYVNGELANSRSLSGELDVNSSDLYIGSAGGSKKFFSGNLDDFRIYNYALSESEIADIYSHLGDANGGGNGGNDPEYSESLIFNMDEGLGVVTEDSTDSASIDLNGTVWSEGIDGFGVYLDNYGDNLSSEVSYINNDSNVLSFWYQEEKDNTGGLLKLQREDGGNLFYLGYKSLPAEVGEWNNVIVSLQDGSIEVYLNGELVSGLQEAVRNDDWVSFEIGGDDVIIDEFRVYNSALTEDLLTSLSTEYEVSSLYSIVGNLEEVLFVNAQGIPVSETEGYIAIKSKGALLAQLNLVEDLSVDVFGVDYSDGVLFLSYSDKSSFDSITYQIPKVNSESTISICPDAVDISTVDCVNVVELSVETPSVSGYELVNVDDVSYWYVTIPESVTSLTLQEVTPVVVIPEISLLSPNDGELIAGSVLDITWESSDTSGVFDIEFSADGFVNNVISVASEVSGSSYTWSVPTDVNGEVELRVVDSNDAGVFGVSDSYLGIYDPIADAEVIWRFEEGSGCDFIDDSGLYSGVLGSDCTSDIPNWTDDGFVDGGLIYDEGDYVTIANERIFNPKNALTVAAWVRWDVEPSTADGWAQIVNKGGEDQYQLQHNSDNSGFEFSINTTRGRRFVIGDVSPVVGEWYFVVGTYDGSEIKLYVNGELDASAGYSGELLSSTDPIVLGKHPTRSREFQGSIDEFSFFNYAWDSSSILERYLVSSNVKPVVDIKGVEFSDGFVSVDYDLFDENNDYLSLTKYEYSLDSGDTWSTMSPEYLSGHNSGVSGLYGDEDGESYKFVWDVESDLGNVYADSVLIRMESYDTLLYSEVDISDEFVVDTKASLIEVLSAYQSEDDGKVYISYSVTEDSIGDIEVSVEASNDLGYDWSIPLSNLSGDYGTVTHEEVLGTYSLVWDVKEDLVNTDSTDIQFKIVVEDLFGNSEESITGLIPVDTKAPFGLDNFVVSANAEYSVLATWNGIEQESNFKGYRIWYSTDSDSLESGEGYIELESDLLNSIDTDAVLITELEANTKYYFKILAEDLFGNSVSSPIVAMTTLKEIDIDEIVLASDTLLSNDSQITVYGVGVPNESLDLIIDEDVFEDWVVTDEFGYFEKVIDFEEGDYSVSLEYKDVARVIGSNVLGISIDLTAPEISTLNMDVLGDEAYVSLSGEAEALSEIFIYIDDVLYDVSPIIVDAEGNWSQEIFVTEDIYEGVVTVVSRDIAGNESGLSVPILLPSFAVQEDLEGAIAGGVGDVNLGDADYGEIINIAAVDEVFKYRVSRLVDSPEVLSVQQSPNTGNVVFGGKGIANSDVVLFVHSEQAFAVKAHVDEYGYWSYTHSPEELALENGDHEVYAITVDDTSDIRSGSSNIFGFGVNITPLVLILNYIDLPTTLIALTILISGIGLVVYSRNKFTDSKNEK